MPDYRAGSYTTPSEGYVYYPTVIFSHPMPNTNYRVSITNADTSVMEWADLCPMGYNCILTIDSKTTTGFTFSWRAPEYPDHPYIITNNHKFDYIAIADN